MFRLNHYNNSILEGIVSYQNEFLQKVFNFESQITPIEELNMFHCSQLRFIHLHAPVHL